jgi:hypothetical protein
MASLIFGIFTSLVVTCIINYVVDEVLLIEVSIKAIGYTFTGLAALITYIVFSYAI